ncbi:putative duf1688 domain protein [Phaeoacremonium minimum UCRPA7]|uniref:Putative duf1688 domain protein n=1 Tax=Phaeoacremonium minimum (strain UCR-PA7) TaxID=1286976 RepID=R8BBQ3_PHAM7|nr:putative duf1688 domain protein [Phaeoacremonium minimum UCRPA7]EON96768.1 putative duf1688 domain protein [Phaeoacremonium minimum UCRPA7]
MSSEDVAYLLSLQAVRGRAQQVLQAAQEGSLVNFNYDAQRLPAVADFVVGVIRRDFGPDKFAEIPPHGRWQHFDVGGVARVAALLDEWKAQGCDELELTRRLIDLFFVSVLLDAGAGDVWKFREPGTGSVYNRSEGIAVASLYMFKAGAFGSAAGVDGAGLVGLKEDAFEKYFQISAENPMIGVTARVKLLQNVGSSLLQLPKVFGPSGRPGNLVDYLVDTSQGSKTLDYEVLWSTLQDVLIPSWPKDRTHIDGKPVGDAWPLKVLELAAEKAGTSATAGTAIQPFHKLTQWLGYSLTVPFVRVLGFQVINGELGTGLPEYRNGGLFVDLGVLQLKPDVLKQGCAASGQSLPMYSAISDTIVEWRAMTVALLDELHKLVSAQFAKEGVQLTMAQMLEAGTWKGGRELAAKYRPETRSSPILIDGDGTLF